jgi:GntR family transcriptional regulator
MAADQAVARSPSLYRKVAEDIRAAIAAGDHAAGTRLPSENELSERYSVSRGTIRQAFAALRADGVIASRRGVRRMVLGGPRVQSFGELLSFSRWARAIGEVPGGRVVALQRRAAKALEAERLESGLRAGAAIVAGVLTGASSRADLEQAGAPLILDTIAGLLAHIDSVTT